MTTFPEPPMAPGVAAGARGYLEIRYSLVTARVNFPACGVLSVVVDSRPIYVPMPDRPRSLLDRHLTMVLKPGEVEQGTRPPGGSTSAA